MVGSKGLDEAETVTKKLSEKKEMAARLCWRLFQFPANQLQNGHRVAVRVRLFVVVVVVSIIFNVNNGQKRLLLLRLLPLLRRLRLA